MSYSDFIQKPISQKNVLFEIDKGEELGDNLWTKYSPGVWVTTYAWESGLPISDGAWGEGPFMFGTWGDSSASTTPASLRTPVNIMGSFEINGELYALVPSVELVESTPKSFFWSSADQMLYVNYDGYIRDTDNSIILGLTTGYSSKSIYFNDIYYDGRIISIPDISVVRDNLFNEVVRFEGGTVTMINTDGAFDRFGDEDIYGRRVRIKFGGDDLPYSEYKSIYTGYLEKYDITDEIITIKIKDERKNLQRSIPTNLYDDTTYPEIKESSVGKPIGIGYGIVLQCPSVCLNETDKVTSTFNFKFVDTTNHNIESIEQVYVDSIEVTHSNESLTGGTFDLSSSDYKPGQKVSISFHGYVDGAANLIVNPLEIIEDLFLIYNDIPYKSDFYNVENWELIKSGLDDISLFVNKSGALIKYVGQITASILGSLIVNGDGLFDIKTVDTGRESQYKVEKSDMINQRVSTENNSNEYISSSRVGYAKLYDENDYAFFIDRSDEEKLVKRYRSAKESEFKTLLTTRFDAVNYSSTTLDLFGGIIPEYTFETKMQLSGLEIEDIITIDISRLRNESEYVRAEVLSKSINYTNSTVKIVARWAGVGLPSGDLIVEHSTDPDYIFKWSMDNPTILENGE